MNYQETLSYLYHIAPLYQRVGAAAYKPGLETSLRLDRHFHHPHRSYRIIHIAGTNGKGSCAHTLAAVLQSAGLRVGLYTSPHLLDFRERIRVQGQMIPQERVVDFVERERAFFEPLHPSFFELTTALALLYFQERQADWAVLECGLGGRLDCTNIVRPRLSVITNISLDHTQYLGPTLADIAGEKAGIIKPRTPVVVGEVLPQTRPVFLRAAARQRAPLTFAQEQSDEALRLPRFAPHFQLTGPCQHRNLRTILSALTQLRALEPGLPLSDATICSGLSAVCPLTGLQGRWQVVARDPLTILDAGHNPGAWMRIAPRLSELAPRGLHLVLGFSADKDVSSVLSLLRRALAESIGRVHFRFTQAATGRALPAEELQALAEASGLHGETYATVAQAVQAARGAARPAETLFVGGSCFIVADYLSAV